MDCHARLYLKPLHFLQALSEIICLCLCLPSINLESIVFSAASWLSFSREGAENISFSFELLTRRV